MPLRAIHVVCVCLRLLCCFSCYVVVPACECEYIAVCVLCVCGRYVLWCVLLIVIVVIGIVCDVGEFCVPLLVCVCDCDCARDYVLWLCVLCMQL
jgi:hypothetical protein